MADQKPSQNAPSVPSTPRTDPNNVPNVPATGAGSGQTSDQTGGQRGTDPLRTTHPGESGNR